MTKITVEKFDESKLETIGVKTWPVWECGPSEFDWEYSDRESCYLLEGKVTVKTDDAEVSFGKGDFVVFPKGLKCRWCVLEKVRKHYKFG